MNVDPRIIAELMTEDPDQFNQPQQPQQPQQPTQSDINKRVLLMLQLVNIANRADVPLTAEGWNQIGRSEGFIRHMSANGPWSLFVISKQFEELASNLSMETKKLILTEMVMSVSRS